MLFEDHLRSKKIDPTAFEAGEPQLFLEWKKAFDQMHPASFNVRYLFSINSVRRKHPMQQASAIAPAAAARPRPVIKPKIS